jgi:hypothetical protein
VSTRSGSPQSPRRLSHLVFLGAYLSVKPCGQVFCRGGLDGPWLLLCTQQVHSKCSTEQSRTEGVPLERQQAEAYRDYSVHPAMDGVIL